MTIDYFHLKLSLLSLAEFPSEHSEIVLTEFARGMGLVPTIPQCREIKSPFSIQG